MTITPADLDAQGCFFFDDDSGEPLIFIASHVKLGLESGLLNLDLIGTFFDFDVSSTGQWADGKADNWYSSEIQNFWVKGDFDLPFFKGLITGLFYTSTEDGTETSINTIDVSTARSSCSSSCGSSDVYYGVRKYDEEQFQCKCFDRKMETVVAEAS